MTEVLLCTTIYFTDSSDIGKTPKLMMRDELSCMALPTTTVKYVLYFEAKYFTLES